MQWRLFTERMGQFSLIPSSYARLLSCAASGGWYFMSFRNNRRWKKEQVAAPCFSKDLVQDPKFSYLSNSKTQTTVMWLLSVDSNCGSNNHVWMPMLMIMNYKPCSHFIVKYIYICFKGRGNKCSLYKWN